LTKFWSVIYFSLVL